MCVLERSVRDSQDKETYTLPGGTVSFISEESIGKALENSARSLLESFLQEETLGDVASIFDTDGWSLRNAPFIHLISPEVDSSSRVKFSRSKSSTLLSLCGLSGEYERLIVDHATFYCIGCSQEVSGGSFEGILTQIYDQIVEKQGFLVLSSRYGAFNEGDDSLRVLNKLLTRGSSEGEVVLRSFSLKSGEDLKHDFLGFDASMMDSVSVWYFADRYEQGRFITEWRKGTFCPSCGNDVSQVKAVYGIPVDQILNLSIDDLIARLGHDSEVPFLFSLHKLSKLKFGKRSLNSIAVSLRDQFLCKIAAWSINRMTDALVILKNPFTLLSNDEISVVRDECSLWAHDGGAVAIFSPDKESPKERSLLDDQRENIFVVEPGEGAEEVLQSKVVAWTEKMRVKKKDIFSYNSLVVSYDLDQLLSKILGMDSLLKEFFSNNLDASVAGFEIDEFLNTSIEALIRGMGEFHHLFEQLQIAKNLGLGRYKLSDLLYTILPSEQYLARLVPFLVPKGGGKSGYRWGVVLHYPSYALFQHQRELLKREYEKLSSQGAGVFILDRL